MKTVLLIKQINMNHLGSLLNSITSSTSAFHWPRQILAHCPHFNCRQWQQQGIPSLTLSHSIQ